MGRRVLGLFLVLSVVVIAIGCGPKRPDFLPKTFPTTVKVVDGATPIEGAQVTLLPSVPLPSVTVYGVTDAMGVAKIGSNAGSNVFDGAPAGEYSVIIAKNTGLTVPSELLPVTGESAEEGARKAAEVAKLREESRVIPAVLEQQGQSPLKMTVDTKGDLTVDVAEYK